MTDKKYQNYLVMDNAEMEKRLKECLGDSNGVTTDNVEVYDWDYGTYTNPHLIKLVDATQDEYVEYLRADGSSYKVLQTDASNDWVDSASQTYPVSLLCNNGKDWVYATAGTGGTSSNRYWGTSGHSTYAGGGAQAHTWASGVSARPSILLAFMRSCISTTAVSTDKQINWIAPIMSAVMQIIPGVL